MVVCPCLQRRPADGTFLLHWGAMRPLRGISDVASRLRSSMLYFTNLGLLVGSFGHFAVGRLRSSPVFHVTFGGFGGLVLVCDGSLLAYLNCVRVINIGP